MTDTVQPKSYRLNKARQTLKAAVNWFEKNKSTLPEHQRAVFVHDVHALDEALLSHDRPQINTYASKLDDFLAPRIKKSPLSYLFEIIVALALALLIATVVRQVWFENQEIPTGSMRPTYKEQDKLIVSKTAFGINAPFSTAHFYFDPSLVHRTGIFTFSADNIPMYDADSTYFMIFPYKKRLVKRVMGKPGDTVYFYGGKVYGIDKEGNWIQDYQEPWMKTIEHIPFLKFSGEVSQTGSNTLILKQMNIPIGKLVYGVSGFATGQIKVNDKWINDNPANANKPHDNIETYSDFWGFRNFAMAQLLTKDQVLAYGDVKAKDLEEAELYLELRHHPSLAYPAPKLLPSSHGPDIIIPGFRSYIPLKSRHLNDLMDSLYTARFVVEGGKVQRYSVEGKDPHASPWKFESVPDGTYEFYFGKAYSIDWGGVATELPAEHPIYDRSTARIQFLFNSGIDFSPLTLPRGNQQVYLPHRYAYFRDGDLYVMGSPLLKKVDPTLKRFLDKETEREKLATKEAPYLGFVDHGPPPSVEFVKTFGLHIPEKSYLALGDNHAMSGDSRVWGFVPEDNIQGAPSFGFWPYPRIGFGKEEAARDWLTVPNMAVWGLALLVAIGAGAWHYRSTRRSQLPEDFPKT